MKIAFISGVFFPEAGGAQVQIHNIANRLTKLGLNIKLFLYNNTNIKNNNYSIVVLDKFIFNIVYFFKYYFNVNVFFLLNPYVLKLIKKYKIDIWHFSFLNFKSLILINILKNFDKKVIVTFHGIDIQTDRSINYGYRLNKKYDFFLKNTLKKIDRFTYISDTIKNDLLTLGVHEDKLIYFPNSVNIEKFEKYSSPDLKKSKLLNLITVARFAEKKKGLDLVQSICESLIEKKVNFKWKIIGKNTKFMLQNKFFKTHKHLFDIIDNIENINEEYFPHSDLIKHYKSSDLYVNLSRIESFGVTYIESLASKVPIISFSGKGSDEIVRDKINGILINKDDILNFTDKICKINDNKKIIEDMSDNCLNSVKKFDLDTNSYNLIDIYKKLN